MEWQAGLPVQDTLPEPVRHFLDAVIFPHFSNLIQTEQNKEVIEKVLECIRDIAEDMGPAGIFNHIEMIMEACEELLDKEAMCQFKENKGQMVDGQANPEESSDDVDSDEDLDHDELILGCVTDLLISTAKAFKDGFLPYLQRLGPRIYKYLQDDHPKSDKIMVIGALVEIFNQCPVAINAFFDEFIQVLLKHSTTDDGSLNRNVSYGFAVFADKATPEKFGPHLITCMQAIKNMHEASEE